MARLHHLPPNDPLAEEDYIDMDFSSATFLCSPPIEFEFQMSAHAAASTPMASPADELFYKGKLLPLRRPPSSHTAEELIQDPASFVREKSEAAATPCSAATTPYMSCNASPAASCFVSGELAAEDYFHECSDELARPHQYPKKSWAQKLRFIKDATLNLKLKAPKAYLKSLFSKSSRRPNEKSAAASKAKETSHDFRIEGKTTKGEKANHRRSFSSASNRQSSTSSSSSKSTSFSSVNSKELQQSMLRRSSSVNSDIESSIQGAIAYCKKSQQKDSARKSASDVGFCLLSATKIAPDTRIKVHELRGKTKAELQNQLKDLKNELSLLRVAKVTGGAPNKLSKIKVVRLSIARVLTVISQKQKAALREAYKNKKLLPLDLRPKKTRAIRRRLTKHQESLKTEREKKREMYFPMRKYAIKA
ncbi:hypothetical protein Cni_G05642 [Canna indica]|uniref:60S ribosomal protein L35 n=1 Tax=Canna indica TaxID=4628 RepID=A0AAQ3JV28_9LILI|nr:hypothetical protein Cni_G05642 [Canna indica]